MELPEDLKALYRHWPLHAAAHEQTPSLPAPSVEPALLEDLRRFVTERMRVWQRKTSGSPPPYTDDAILGRFRFCNMFRELDRQTIAFHRMLNPLRDDFPLWLLNMFYCRMVARPETVEAVGLLSFDAAENEALYERLMASSRPRFGTPYVFPVSVIQRSPYPTRELLIASYLPSVMRAVATEIDTWERMSVYDGIARVLPVFDFNLSFLWTEVLIDVAYQFPERVDLFGRFPAGPGSAPTLARIDPDKDPSLLVQELSSIPLDTGLTLDGEPLRLSAENWEGVCCEFRKYTNLAAGRGRRRLYAQG